MKSLAIGILILLGGFVIGKYLIQNYYYSKLLGQWGGKFAADVLDDNRLTVKNIKLIFKENGTMYYEINLAAVGQGFKFTSWGLSVNKASRTTKRYVDGHFHYEWPRIHIELFPRNLPNKIEEAYLPFTLDAVSKDPQTGKPLIKLSANVGFEGDMLLLQGAVKDPIRLSRDGNVYNDLTIQQDDEIEASSGRPRVIKRVIKSNGIHAQ